MKGNGAQMWIVKCQIHPTIICQILRIYQKFLFSNFKAVKSIFWNISEDIMNACYAMFDQSKNEVIYDNCELVSEVKYILSTSITKRVFIHDFKYYIINIT